MSREFRGNPHAASGPIAIVVSRYNDNVTKNLLSGALATLSQYGIEEQAITVAWVPGAWEIPVVAQQLAAAGRDRAIICLGAVIRGETTHDQYINQQVSQALGAIARESGLPVLFGVLTCQTLEQAIHRSGGRLGNKGAECAEAALEMIDLLARLRE